MEDKKRKPEKTSDPKDMVKILPNEGKGQILSDVTGSYTGTPVDSLHPLQDADDL